MKQQNITKTVLAGASISLLFIFLQFYIPNLKNKYYLRNTKTYTPPNQETFQEPKPEVKEKEEVKAETIGEEKTLELSEEDLQAFFSLDSKGLEISTSIKVKIMDGGITLNLTSKETGNVIVYAEVAPDKKSFEVKYIEFPESSKLPKEASDYISKLVSQSLSSALTAKTKSTLIKSIEIKDSKILIVYK